MTGEHPVWEMVDEGWGRKAVDFATLAEPNSVREYVTMQHRLGVDRGDRLVDVACGSGLALELAGLRGASCAGIDASRRLIAVARDRNPDADLRVGDMYALPWPEGLAPAAQPPEQDPMAAAMQQMRYRQGRSLAEVKGPTLPCLAGDGVLYATGEPWRLTAFIGPRPPRGESSEPR